MFLTNFLLPKKFQDGFDEFFFRVILSCFVVKIYYCPKVVMMLNLLINLGEFETHKRPQAFLSSIPSVKGDIN
jgi:hypothetical protein